jgi:hypothetical protein
MHSKEVNDLNNMYPLMGHVIRMIENGENITPDSPFYQTYLAACQLGLVYRTGEDGKKISSSPRANDFFSLLKKRRD